MPQPIPPRRLAAVWFADIVGYTGLSSSDEAAALALVRLLQEVAAEEVATRSGRVVKFVGDAVLAEFPGVEAALEAGLGLSERFGDRARTAHGGGATLRIGVHLGEIACEPDGDIYGDVVNVASRIQAEADPGQTLVTEDVWRQLQRRPAFVFESAGPRTLRGLARPVTAWVARRRWVASDGEGGAAREAAEGARRKRVVVLPFHLLRADPEIDFLSFALADAVAVTLQSQPSLVVRSTARAARWTSPVPDPVEIARETGVDLVLSGTILRAGERVRVTSQLAEGGNGTIVWSETTTATLDDLFELQDELARRIVASVAGPAVPYEDEPTTDVPASSEAYALYLRANQLSVQFGDWALGAELYEEALVIDPGFAPAWARLGRCRRLLGKYAADPDGVGRMHTLAQEAFTRALELNPDLDLVHSLYAALEVEAGRPVDAMIRLLTRARRRPAVPDLFVGLTHACRYCGLTEASLAAHRRALELDPDAQTSAAYTYFQTGEFERALELSPPGDPLRGYALNALGRVAEAEAVLREVQETTSSDGLRAIGRALLLALGGRREEAVEAGRLAVRAFPDPEGRYFMASLWAGAGVAAEALELLAEVIEGGFACAGGLRHDPSFSALRRDPSFGALIERAEAAADAAAIAFRAAGARTVLGPNAC